MDIPRYDERLESMLFKLRFEKEAEELSRSLNTVKVATEEVLQSKKLARILEVVLKLGNFLNGGTARGGIYGFKLDALLKLATIK
jgi:diaphanous 1